MRFLILMFLWSLPRKLLGLKLEAFSSGIAANISLQLLNGSVLRRDNPIDEVANRDDAQDAVAVKHREVADAMVGHQAHAFFDRVYGTYLDDLAGKDFFHRGLFRRFTFEGDLARIIAFRDNAYESAILYDQQCADIFVGHHLDGIEDSGVRRDGPDSGAFVAQDFSDRTGWIHRCFLPQLECALATEVKPESRLPIAPLG